MAELEGRTLGRYELRWLIGKGGMANVYEGYDTKFQRKVAVKVFKREDEEMLRRFIREAELMARLHHPNLVEVYDAGAYLLDGLNRYYIIMPLLTGGTLRARIRRDPSLTLAEVCTALQEIADALDYVHSQGIIHRDIKASNVLLDDRGHCYLTDFGIARVVSEATQMTGSGSVLGTADYIAPELFETDQRADTRSDLYSLGVLLFEMVTGRLPFTATNQLALVSMHMNMRPPSPRQYVPQISTAIEQVLYKGLEKKPNQRYRSASELALAFCRVAQAENAGTLERASVAKLAVAGPVSHSADGELLNAAHLPNSGSVPRSGQPVASSSTTPSTGRHTASPVPPSPSPRTTSRWRSQRGLFVALLGLVVLLILAVPVTYAILNYPSSPTNPVQTGNATQAAATGTSGISPTPTQVSPTPNLTQTVQAQSTATAIVTGRATATAIAGATATVNAQASATVAPIHTATAGQVAYQDALNNPNNAATKEADWDQGSQCAFASDGYHVKQGASFPFFKGCREQNNTYGDFALSVDMDMLGGHSGGVFFRLGTNLLGNYDGYLFELDSEGNYKISLEQGSTVTSLQDWTPTKTAQTGYSVVNFLQIIARGDAFLFYVNGQFLVKIQNSYYSQPDTVGFLATSVSGGDDAEVIYTNLTIFTLS